MEIDWSYVKQTTLWHYEDLIEKILSTLEYHFVQDCYNHSMEEAQRYCDQVRGGYLQDDKGATFIEQISGTFKALQNAGIEHYLNLVQEVKTRDLCKAFVTNNAITFEDLIQTLNYLFRWVLPFRLYLRELIDVEKDTDKRNLKGLNQYGIKTNLDLLEQCRTRVGRAELSHATQIAEDFLVELTHRADISRLAYVRGKTVRHLCGGGYNTLSKIAAAESDKMEGDMAAYYQGIGKKLADFKSVIPLEWMVGGARTLPIVIEE